MENNNNSITNLITKPVIIYNDCVQGKKEIFKNYKDTTGIYMWYNNINGKKYIGSAYKLYNRINDYFRPLYKPSNRLIDRSMIKYGKDKFSLIILEIIDKNFYEDKKIFKSFYLSREQFYMDLYKPEYNLCPTAGSLLGFIHSEETKNKLRGPLNPFYGKRHTPESLEKISNASKGDKNPMYGKPKSAEFIAHQNKDKTGSNNHMSKKVYVYNYINKENIYFKEFDTIISVAKYLGCSKTTISKYCREGKIYYPKNLNNQGFFFSFILCFQGNLEE